jgi:predicted DNA-binding transcriptional regulator AlpA
MTDRLTLEPQAEPQLPDRHVDDDTIESPSRVAAMTGLSVRTIWRLRRLGKFPEPIQLSERRLGWRRRVIRQWLADREEKGRTR